MSELLDDPEVQQMKADSAEVDWAIIKSLMEAQSNANASLERYLLCVTHDEFDLDEEHVENCLSQAIEHQRRALEDLEVARELVAGQAE